MQARTRASAVVLVTALGTAAAGTLAPIATSAERAPSDTRVIASSLDGPFGLQAIRNRGFLVAENVTGEVTKIDRHGHKRAIITRAGSVAGVAAGHARVYAVLGGADETGAPAPGSKYPASAVLRSRYDGSRVKVIANLEKYELKHNPDGQVQFVDGEPVDALSNPFSLNKSRLGLLVADGGANDVLRVNPKTGRVSTFFVPPTVKDVPACQGPDANANPGTQGCDPVPTGVDVRGRSVFVSTLGAERPGAARIYKLNARTGHVQRVWKNFTGLTGIAVTRNGTIYVSEVFHGAPEGDPGPGFDPSTVGRITKISHGKRTYAQVTMPTGLEVKHGKLYASTWSVANFLGLDHAGKIEQVRQSAFH